MNDGCLIWLEKAYSKIHKSYYVISISFSILILLIFMVFHLMVPMLNFEFWYEMEIVAIAILIALQQIMVIHTIRNSRNIIRSLDIISDEESKSNLYTRFTDIYKLKYIISINIFVVVPFFVIDLVLLSKGEANSFYLWLHTSWSLLFDIFNYSLSYLVNYFLSIQLFINLSIIYIISSIDRYRYKNYIKLGDIEKSNIGIANLLSVSTTYYFISLGLAIITYMSPLGLITIQSILYIILILIGLIIFLLGRKYLNNIYRERIKNEKDRLYSISETYYENIFQKSSNQIDTNKEDKITILLKINLINIMLIRLNNIKFNIFDLNNLFGLIISFMASISAILIRMTLASEFVNYFLAMVHLI